MALPRRKRNSCGESSERDRAHASHPAPAALRALSFAGGDPLFQKLTKQLGDALLAKHRGLTDKFLEIAERKVGVVDDYGENWDALEKGL